MHQAKLYSHANELQLNDARKVLDEFGTLLKWKEHDDSLMDIGCGSGDVTVDLVISRMPHNYKIVVGMDISEKMIDFAKRKYGETYTDLRFEQGNIESGVKYCNEFDHITSFFCLHWVQNQRRALSNIYQMLKPGGDCLISLLAHIPLFDAYERMSESTKWAKYMQDVGSFISPYQKSMDPVKQAKSYLGNFTVAKVFLRERTYIYSNIDVLKASMRAVNPFLSRLPANEEEHFISDLVQKVTDMGLRKDGAYISPYKILIIYAVK